MKQIALLVALTCLAGCQTTTKLTQDQFPSVYSESNISRGEMFVHQCEKGTRELADAKEIAHGQMVVTPNMGEDAESYWYAFASNGRVYLLINNGLDDIQLDQVRALGTGWQAMRVDELSFNGIVWAGRMFDQYTVVSFRPLKANRAALVTGLQRMITSGWLHDVVINP
ncbi:MAG: hypothetical protein WC675_03155 [Patescibacteria group bacterium]